MNGVFDPQDQQLVAFGDAYLGQLVDNITGASFWSKGNNAIAIIYDEGDDSAGCCDATKGGGRVASIVVTSHGPRKFQDPTQYNHFSLLQTIQLPLGIGCLEFTCDTANVKPMTTPLFAVTGSQPVHAEAKAVPNFDTPSPTPDEPVTFTTNTQSSDGWTVVPAPARGTKDNSLGGVAGSAPNDVWAVSNFLPDTASSNQNAALTLAMHFDGKRWAVTPTPNTGPNFNTLFGAAAAGGRAWGVAVALNNDFKTRGLIESWDPTARKWRIDDVPQPGTERDLFFGASALAANDVWAVGEQQCTSGTFSTLVEHWDGSVWRVVPSPNPGAAVGTFVNMTSGANSVLVLSGQEDGFRIVNAPNPSTDSALLGAATAVGDTVWAVGHFRPTGPREPLIMHHPAR